MSSQNLLDAFGALNAALEAGGDTVIVIPLSRIAEDPRNPRSGFDDAELSALAETIRDKGVLQPITVRPAGPDGRYLVRFGARRLRAAALAGLTEIRALVQVGDREEADALVEQLIENDQRESLNTAELARAVDRLLALKLSQSEIARRLGRPRDQIALLAAVRTMPAELKTLAPVVGTRTLFELNAAWKRNEGRVAAWLAERDPKTITQAEARELAGRPVASRRAIRDPSDGSVSLVEPAVAEAPRTRQRSRPAPAPRGATALFEVQAPGVKGTLVLDNVSAPSAEVLIRTAEGEIVTAPAAKVKLVRVTPG